MKVFIMRGLPGSGKSHWIKQHHPDATVASADNFHMILVDGKLVYDYKPERASEAHNWCLRLFLHHLMAGVIQTLIVDNTNTTPIEICPFLRLAEAFGADPEIVFCDCPLDVAAARGVHGVPEATYVKMAARLASEQLPPWWKVLRVPTGPSVS